MKGKYFVASDGCKINFIDGWFDVKREWPYGISSVKEWSEHIYTGTPVHPIGYMFFVNKMTMFNYFYEVMSENLLIHKRERCLDIGTGLGFQPRLMKAMKMVDEAWGLDLLDRSDEMTTELMAQSVEEFKHDTLEKTKLSDRVIKVSTNRSFDMDVDYPVYVPYYLSPESNYSIDKYIVSDFMTWNPSNEKFDIITAIYVTDFLKTDNLFEKIRYMLTDNGVFFVIVGNWYDIHGASMGLIMDAPWMHARLTKNDMIRYYKEVHPDIAPYAEKCLYFADSHMAPIDYANKAANHGLQCIFYRRSRSAIQGIVLPFTTGNGGKLFYSEVLPQAMQVNPNVRAPDLFAHYLTMIFVKGG